MIKSIVIKIIRVTFWTSQHIFPYSICSHRGLNIGGHHCVQDVQNIQLVKKLSNLHNPENFPATTGATGAANGQLWSNLEGWMRVQGDIKNS